MATETRTGKDLIGEEVARDFGDNNGGVFFGKVVGYEGGRRPLYRIEYSDGDMEDFDVEQLEYAMEFAADIYSRVDNTSTDSDYSGT